MTAHTEHQCPPSFTGAMIFKWMGFNSRHKWGVYTLMFLKYKMHIEKFKLHAKHKQ